MATLQIQQSTDFTASSVQFENPRKNKHGGKVVYLNNVNGSKLRIQLPKMKAPFGLSNFVDEKKGTPSYSIDLAFEDDGKDGPINNFRKQLEALDKMVVEFVAKNSKELLGREMKIQTIEDALLYKPLVRPPSKEGYAHTLHLKVLQDEKSGKFVPEAYSLKKKKMDLSEIEKQSRLICIADIASIYFINGKFGVSFRLQQCLVYPSETLKPFAFVGVEDDIQAASEDEEAPADEAEDEDVDDQQETGSENSDV